MPDYIALPRGHGEVRVETWIKWGVLSYYRHFYVSTEVARPWQDILAELTEGKRVKVWNFVDLVKPDTDGRNWFGPGLDQKTEHELGKRFGSAFHIARPMQHGGFGDPLPDSFVIFEFRGPDDHKGGHAQSHHLRYRLTIKGATQTLVEVWDNKWFSS